MAVLALLAGCVDARPADAGPAWSAVPESPLSPRRAPVTAWVGERFVVVGGWSGAACPPNADCAFAPETMLKDGAAFDPATGTWESIAPAPAPVPGAATAVVGDVLYVLTADRAPDAPANVLAYDSRTDTWAALPQPPGAWSGLVAAGDALVAIAGTDEYGSQPDAVLVPATQTWRELPDDPLGPSYDRQALWLGDRLLLTAKDLVPSPGSEEPSLVRLAELDGTMTDWSAPRDTDVIGWGAVWAGGRVVFPETGSADGGEVNNWGRSYPAGGVLDPADWTWRALAVPAPGASSNGLPTVVVGNRVIVADGLLDPVSGEWSPLPQLPEVRGGDAVVERGVAANEHALFVWGGGTTGGAIAEGYLLRP